MKKFAHNTLAFAAVTFLFILLFAPTVYAEKATPGFNYKIPASIMTPDKVETSIGTLEFYDGLPSKETSKNDITIIEVRYFG